MDNNWFAAPAKLYNMVHGESDPNLATAVDKIVDGVGTLVQIGKNRANMVIQFTGSEKAVAKIHQLVKNNSELLFWALALVNMWQHWMLFAVGTAAGLTIAGAGEKIHLIEKSVQLLKTKEALTGYDYLSGALFLVLAPWLNSLQSGIAVGNYLGNPPPTDRPEGFLAMLGLKKV